MLCLGVHKPAVLPRTFSLVSKVETDVLLGLLVVPVALVVVSLVVIAVASSASSTSSSVSSTSVVASSSAPEVVSRKCVVPSFSS